MNKVYSIQIVKIIKKSGKSFPTRKNCDELIKLLSDENFFKPPTFERRKTALKKELELLYTMVWHKFLEKYRED